MSQSGLSHAAAAPPKLSTHAAETARLAAPLAIAQLSQMAMGVTDTILLGALGAGAIAAGGLGSNIFFFAVTLLQGVLSSVSVTVANARGSKAEHRVPPIYWSGLVLSVLLTVPAFAVLSFTEPILLLFGEPAALARDVGAYTAVLRWASLGSLIGVGMMRAFLPAIGAAKRLLWISVASVGVNAVLNYGLIHGAYGLPRLGLLGSATATTVTIWLTAIALVALLHGRPRYRHFVAAARPNVPLMSELFGIGWPVAITFGVESALFLATGLMAGLFGETHLAANQIALNVTSVLFMVPLAIGQAANVRVGYWIGAGHPLAARHAGFVALGLGIAFMSLSGLLLIIAPHAIVGLYLNLHDPVNAQTVAIATALLGIAAVYQIVDGMQVIGAGCLRGLKDTRIPMVAAAFGYWGVGFPTGYLLAFHADLGARGLWWGLAAGLSSVALLLTLRFERMTRPHRK
ncbi:MATE family efflux transporter [Trinickia caryophylli]|uniref:Multidrug-efflux transporter n=1 Tax=Trinickia caryophylli TaxID=28094 RepID=A0A1X7DV41_TRICW|nr:MATE family efflux transporter [Trinickia caryophylli]PMS09179.1 MATE family efflux transporter [Trinickia caryophylli]TRX18022.1 MATE family efflux transporter [Trinickia caryophylli]WQE11199.1 MATE family efflux transporter [Trinickia caryophylli]SMF21587.1 multidrug resistance protein, MATE family [Trinickia caryophylli]GLU32342.1 putative multidrug resistance protein NorM [Trinickia caryophylli]